MAMCPHGIDCEVVNTTQYFHGHGDIVTGQQLWHDEEERCLTFEEWMAAVDRELLREVGLTHRDLADYLYYDDYESDEAPSVTAWNVIYNEGLS